MAPQAPLRSWLSPGAGEFEEHRRQWNGMIDRHPRHIARCDSPEAVSEAVRWSRAADVRVTARGGGHGVSGAAIADDALLIDLAKLNSVTVDPDRRIASLGGGALLRDLDRETQAHGLAVTAGVEPETGVGGLTLGGGIGFLARKLGLTIDNLISAEAVLADGRIVHADQEHEPDLFWALRGGGGGLAIVTRFDFRLHPIGPQVAHLQAFYSWEDAGEVFAGYRDYVLNAPDEVGAYALFVKIPDTDPFPEDRRGKSAVAIVAMHCGPHLNTATDALLPLGELGKPILQVCGPTDYLAFQKSFAGAAPRGERYYWKSHFLKDLDQQAVAIMAEWAKDLPGAYSNVFIEAMGGAIGRVAADATAFPHRTAKFNLGISTGWNDSGDDEAMISRTRALFDDLKPFSTGGVYSNYLDFDETERSAGAFGENLGRLVEVRSHFDPDQRFL